jgi:2-polyprenyl-6-methoxyphenol hydroxylase-like FAD-dependent oxidoreductase
VHDVLIAGGGIGGLTAAIALARRGVVAPVFDAMPDMAEVGAGIGVPANALQALGRLNLSDAFQSAGCEIKRIELRDVHAGLIRSMNLDAVKQRFGSSLIMLHRATLQRILADNLPLGALHLGRRCVALENLPDRVRIHFGDGETEEAAMVVAADGLRSVARAQLFPDAAAPRYAGQTSWRAVVDCRLPPEFEHSSVETWGAGHRFGFAPIGDGRVYWYATADAPPNEKDPPGELPAALATIAGLYQDPIPALVSTAKTIVRTDLFELPPLATWHRGRIALLGDAAHAMTPNLGQGGAQAIEDAFVLAEQLCAAPADPSAAFAHYERIRMPKAHRLVKLAGRFGVMAHLRNPLARGLRNALLRLTPEAVARGQNDRLYGLNF